MRCPVCDALHREDSLACQAEAKAILQQRYEMIRVQPEESDQDTHQERQEIVVSSRHLQLKIASRLKEHKALAHSA